MKSYCYKNTNVLINNFGVRTNEELFKLEAQYSYFRITQLSAMPKLGNFDLKHLQAIHKHIFQDVYPWAGEVRNVNISKGHMQFANCNYIIPEMNKLSNQLKNENYLTKYSLDQFSDRLAYYGAEINVLHPFREGNGRSTREYLRSLAEEAGYEINYSLIDKAELYKAFVKSVTDYTDLKSIFKSNIIENLKRKYEKEWPAISIADENFIDRLNKVVIKYLKDNTVSLTRLKNIHSEMGQQIELGLSASNEDFLRLDEIITEARKYQNEFNHKITQSTEIHKAELDKNMVEEL